MKKIILLFLVAFLLIAGGACSKKSTSPQKDTPTSSEKKIRYYTCPMHPQIHKDEPGTCPICGMNLVPVYEEEKGSTSIDESSSTDRTTIQIPYEKQQLIGVKTAKVESKPILREIHATGSVAYHPELFTAQQEYLIALQTAGAGEVAQLQAGLVRSAKLRLQLLGMSEEQIRKLRRAEQSLLLPKTQGTSWIYGAIPESDLAWVRTGTPVEVFIPGAAETYHAQVESINPTIDSSTRTAQIRIPLPQSSGFFKPDLYVKLLIHAETPAVLSLPETAVIDTGSQQIAFVALGDGRFEPRKLKIGRRGSHDIEVMSGVSADEEAVVSANFLIDSESRLKAALSSMENHRHD